MKNRERYWTGVEPKLCFGSFVRMVHYRHANFASAISRALLTCGSVIFWHTRTNEYESNVAIL